MDKPDIKVYERLATIETTQTHLRDDVAEIKTILKEAVTVIKACPTGKAHNESIDELTNKVVALESHQSWLKRIGYLIVTVATKDMWIPLLAKMFPMI